MRYKLADYTGVIEEIEAWNMEEAIEIAKDLWQEGDWDDGGDSIQVRVHELNHGGDVVDTAYITVDIEPNHAKLIRAAAGYDDICGEDPDDHEWTSEGEGGMKENPGVWSTGGTSMVFYSHCRVCGLHRTERVTGSQRNPDECNTVEYRMLDAEEMEYHVRNGSMDE